MSEANGLNIQAGGNGGLINIISSVSRVILGNRRSKGLRKTPFAVKYEDLAGDVGLGLGFATLTFYVAPCGPLHG